MRLSEAVSGSAYGPRFSNSLYSPDGEIGQLRTTDMSENGDIDYATIPRANLSRSEMGAHILEDGDFLISRSGTCGIAAVFKNNGVPTIPGAFLIRIRLNERLSSDYLREYVNSRVGRQHMNRLAAGGVQKNIRGSSLLTEVVPMPSVAVQKRFLETYNEQRQGVEACNRAITATKALLQGISNSLFP